MLAPTGASAGVLDDVGRTVNDTVRNVNDTVRGLTGGGGGNPQQQPAPAAGPEPQAASTEPTLDGTNPHGQGTVLDIDVVETPLTSGPDDIVIGRSRGEQDEFGKYHGKVTIVSALGLEVAIETDEGQAVFSPLQPVNDLLANICASSGNNVCLTALNYGSASGRDSSFAGSFNHFDAASANIGNGLVTAALLESNGNIGDDGNCQAAHGDASAADVGLAGGLVGVDALFSESDSFSCRNGDQGSSAESGVLLLNDVEVFDFLGCALGATDVEFEIVPGFPVLAGVCNGDSTSQAVPFNVRKALQLDVLPLFDFLFGGPLLSLNAGSSESLTQAPECPGENGTTPPDEEPPVNGPILFGTVGPVGDDCPIECPDGTVVLPGEDCPEEQCPEDEVAQGDECLEVCPDGELVSDDDDCPEIDECPDADDPDCVVLTRGPVHRRPIRVLRRGQLPFTGADLGLMVLIGLGVMGTGLGTMALSDRRRRLQTPQ
jgi:hypothetical protein